MQQTATLDREPGKFFMPSPADERYNWMQVRLATLDERELAELITDAWCMVVSKKTAGGYFAAHPDLVPPTGGPAG